MKFLWELLRTVKLNLIYFNFKKPPNHAWLGEIFNSN